jgi:hypothetical protein
MATTTAKVLARGTLTDSNATLYTVPSATKAIITNIVFCNIDSATRTLTLELDGVELTKDLTVNSKSTVTIDLKQVLDAADLIEGLASANTAITYHISGIEIA